MKYRKNLCGGIRKGMDHAVLSITAFDFIMIGVATYASQKNDLRHSAVRGETSRSITHHYLVGLVAGNAIAYATEYFTSYTDKPTQAIANATQSGAATTIIQGLAVGMMSTVLPVLIVAVAILLSIWLGFKADGTIAATTG